MNNILHCIEYCIYRISRFYIKRNPKFGKKKIKVYDMYAGGAIFGLLLCGNLFTLCFIIGYIFGFSSLSLLDTELFFRTHRGKPFAIMNLISLLFVLCGMYYGSKLDYDTLSRKYDSEPQFNLKGFFVILYIILTMALFCLSCYFDNKLF